MVAVADGFSDATVGTGGVLLGVSFVEVEVAVGTTLAGAEVRVTVGVEVGGSTVGGAAHNASDFIHAVTLPSFTNTQSPSLVSKPTFHPSF